MSSGPRDPGLEALIPLGLRLAQNTSLGRIVLARVAEAVDPAWLPTPWRSELVPLLRRALQGRPEPLAAGAVERALCAAWDVRRLADELESLSPDPVRLTPTAQIHHGVRAGRDVAVKLLIPGLAAGVRQDLALAELLAAPAGIALPRERILAAFDLEHEATQLRRLARTLGDDGPVLVARPVPELCRENVLVSDWLVAGGIGLGLNSAASALLQFVIGGIRRGAILCDLSAAGILPLADGHIGVLDAGLVADVAVDTVADACLAELGAFRAGAYPALAEALGPLGQPGRSRLDVAAVAAVLERAQTREAEVAAELLAVRRSTGIGPLLAAGVAQLFCLLARAGVSADWPEQVGAALARPGS